MRRDGDEMYGDVTGSGWLRAGYRRSRCATAAGRVVQAAVARKERAEDAEAAPAMLDLRFAKLAPPGLVPVK